MIFWTSLGMHQNGPIWYSASLENLLQNNWSHHLHNIHLSLATVAVIATLLQKTAQIRPLSSILHHPQLPAIALITRVRNGDGRRWIKSVNYPASSKNGKVKQHQYQDLQNQPHRQYQQPNKHPPPLLLLHHLPPHQLLLPNWPRPKSRPLNGKSRKYQQVKWLITKQYVKLTHSTAITVGQRLGTTDAAQSTRYGGTDNEISSTDIEEEDDHDGISNKRSRMDDKLYVPPTIQTQMDFDRLCREHQHTQQAYIRFKKTFTQKHPIFIQALAAVNEQDKTLFVRKLKAYYQSKGGDMNNWRHLMQLSRQFNGTHAKINMMWNTIETAYRQNKFSLRLHRKSSSSSSAASSASSSSPPIPSSSSSVSVPYNKYTRRWWLWI